MGQVTFSKDNFSTPAPIGWKRKSDAIKYFLVALIGMLSTADMFPTQVKNYITFGCVFIIGLLKAADMFMGVAPTEEPPKLDQ